MPISNTLPVNFVPTPVLSQWELDHHTPEQIADSVKRFDASFKEEILQDALNTAALGRTGLRNV